MYVCMYVRMYVFLQNKENSSLKLQLKFLNLIDKLVALLSTTDVVKLTDICKNLLASNIDQILLFNSNIITKLKNNPYPFIFKIYLLPFLTWFDHSILRELIESINSNEAIDLIKQFDSCIDHDHLITSYAIPEFSQLIIPCKGNESEYILLVTKYFKNHNEVLLRDLMIIKEALILEWEITDHAILLVAKHSKLSYFYWLIPRSIRPLIEEKLTHDQHALWDKGILMINLLPDNYWDDECNQCSVGQEFNLMSFNMKDATKVCSYVHTCMHTCTYVCTITWYSLCQSLQMINI